MWKKRWAALLGVAVATAATAVVVQAWPQGADDSDGDAAASQAEPPPEPPRISAEERIELQKALNKVVEEGASGAVAELVEANESGRDRWNGVAGIADRQTRVPVDPGAHFRIASLSKPFVAAVMLQLVAEGEVRLSDTVEEVLPGVLDGGEDITLRMLLSHTSGVFSYNKAMPAVRNDPKRVWKPEELVEVANEEGPDFEPGADVDYSNTNYVLAAMIIEEVTGRPYTEEIADRIITPLELSETSIPASPEMPSPVMRAYVAERPYAGADPEPSDITEFNPTRWYGTAQIVSTVSDINRFWEALLGGEILDAEMLGEMLTVQGINGGGVGYALGPRQYTLSCELDVWMHSGNIPGYRTWTVHDDKDRHFTMFQARYVQDPDPPAWETIETALCPPDAPEEPDPTPTDYPSEPVEGTGRGEDSG
ncbi:serine hydrolase domain-containing protein [Allosalinactinospora lopnorensis]|uniref:serine hydrolase domain-containing protein n=1 Tax=Allosalinactinospora lopnorensis TaxID=1352348 RepID=UPI000623E921|nr:serine hydrolase domain-containing protein [Allosalinactinospora lopnorensis]